MGDPANDPADDPATDAPAWQGAPPPPPPPPLSFVQRARALRAHEFLIFAILLIALALCLAAAPFIQGVGGPGGGPAGNLAAADPSRPQLI